MTPTPASLAYSMPPEFAPQCATWLSWPRPEGISFPGRYHTIMPSLTAIVREIALRQDVHINVPNENWQRIVTDALRAHNVPTRLLIGARRTIFFHHIRTNECWCRDHGPAFVVSGKKAAIVDWKFNAWGGKYPPWDDDDRVPTEIATRARMPLFHAPIVMEGGSVEFSGRGTVLTTSQCLLNKNRNPGASKQRIERYLREYYGQKHVLWLGEGIEGDDTDGHIDDLARFLSPTTILIAVEENTSDANHRQLERAFRKLLAMRDQDGDPFDILTIPMPGPVIIDGQRCPATYINFLFVQGAVLVPTFGDRVNDRRALAVLRAALPEREVVGVDCRDLIWGLGAIHCLTQQVPDVPGLRDRLRRVAAKPIV
jgi:agmatine deiminase